MQPYRAVCFDFDYTLADATDSIVAGFQHGFTKMGWPAPDRETVRGTIGYLLEDAYTMLTGDSDPARRAQFFWRWPRSASAGRRCSSPGRRSCCAPSTATG